MTDEAEPTTGRLLHALDLAGRVSIFMTPLLVIFAIVEDRAYCLLIDPSIFRAMSVADHISGILEILPMAGLGLIIGGTLGAMLVATYPPAATVAGSSEMLVFHRTRAGYTVLVIGLIASSILVTYFPVRILLVLFSVVTIFPAVLVWTKCRPSTKQLAVLLIGYSTSSYLLTAISVGLVFAANDLLANFPTHRIVLTSGRTIDHAVVFRAIEQGLYVRDLDARVQLLVTWPEVREVARINSSVSTFEQLACRLARTC
jgi:hypothetical protein